MPHKDSFEDLLNQGLEPAETRVSDPSAFDEAIQRKIGQRKRQRRGLQVAALFVCALGIGGISQLTQPVHDGTTSPIEVAEAERPSSPRPAIEIEAESDTAEMAGWEEDPFDNWNDDMPADYDLVAGI